jgi:hypothetical protein
MRDKDQTKYTNKTKKPTKQNSSSPGFSLRDRKRKTEKTLFFSQMRPQYETLF